MYWFVGLFQTTSRRGTSSINPDNLIIGADYHPAFQQIAFVDTETGELQERRLDHPEEAEKFYRELAVQGNESTRGDGSQRASALVRATAYEQLKKFGSHAGQPGNRDGVK
jgi:hypothetical protein